MMRCPCKSTYKSKESIQEHRHRKRKEKRKNQRKLEALPSGKTLTLAAARAALVSPRQPNGVFLVRLAIELDLHGVSILEP